MMDISRIQELRRTVESMTSQLENQDKRITKLRTRLSPEDLYWNPDGRRGKYGLAFHNLLEERDSLKKNRDNAKNALHQAARVFVATCLVQECVFLHEDAEAMTDFKKVVLCSLDNEDLADAIHKIEEDDIETGISQALLSDTGRNLYYGQYGEYWLSKISHENGAYITPLLPGCVWDEDQKYWVSSENGVIDIVLKLPPTENSVRDLLSGVCA